MKAQATRPGGHHCLNERGGLETGEQTSNSTTVDQAPMLFQPATATIAELLSEHERVEMWTLRERLAAEEWSGDEHHT